ncbi:MAG TPA: hypothetical protein VFQ77_01650 [Pseudonocardiaceae bacterium]|jgi:acyl dehydratase|nr:hypothetical protein [Pseudonocardiaceae bacterium]
MTVRSTSGMTSANLALDEGWFERPVHVGDTLRAAPLDQLSLIADLFGR